MLVIFYLSKMCFHQCGLLWYAKCATVVVCHVRRFVGCTSFDFVTIFSTFHNLVVMLCWYRTIGIYYRPHSRVCLSVHRLHYFSGSGCINWKMLLFAKRFDGCLSLFKRSESKPNFYIRHIWRLPKTNTSADRTRLARKVGQVITSRDTHNGPRRKIAGDRTGCPSGWDGK